MKKRKFFEDLKEGLEEILAHKQGKITLCLEHIATPNSSKHDSQSALNAVDLESR